MKSRSGSVATVEYVRVISDSRSAVSSPSTSIAIATSRFIDGLSSSSEPTDDLARRAVEGRDNHTISRRVQYIA
jgi:hypothetical protein